MSAGMSRACAATMAAVVAVVAPTMPARGVPATRGGMSNADTDAQGQAPRGSGRERERSGEPREAAAARA